MPMVWLVAAHDGLGVDSVSDLEDIGSRLRAERFRAFMGGGRELDAAQADEVERLLARAGEIYASAVTDRTRYTYGRRWALFSSWCASHGLPSLPAAPETVMLYLGSATETTNPPALSTVRGWLSAINRVHLEAGFTPPGRGESMALFVRGLARLLPERGPGQNMSALRIEALREVMRGIDTDADRANRRRDRAVLGLHIAGVTSLVMSRLDWVDIEFTVQGLMHLTQHSGSDQTHTLTIDSRPDDAAVCPVIAMKEWAECVSPLDGPVFRQIFGGEVMSEGINGKRSTQIRWSRTKALGEPGRPVSPETAMRLLLRRSPIDERDRAALLIGWAGAFRRTEIVGLRWADLSLRDLGLVVHLRRSKTDLAGRGTDVGIPYGRSELTCPVRAFLDWQTRVEEQHGAINPESHVFLNVGRSGRIYDEPLTAEGIARLVHRRADAVGLQGRWGGRSLRAGFITTAAEQGIPVERIATQSRHKTLNTLALYIRRESPFRGNPAGQAGL